MRISVELNNLTETDTKLIGAALEMVQSNNSPLKIDKMWWSQQRQLCIAAIEMDAMSFSITTLSEYIKSILEKATSLPNSSLLTRPGLASLLLKFGIGTTRKADIAAKREELVNYANQMKENYMKKFTAAKTGIIDDFNRKYQEICNEKEQKLRNLVAEHKEILAKIDADLATQLTNI